MNSRKTALFGGAIALLCVVLVGSTSASASPFFLRHGHHRFPKAVGHGSLHWGPLPVRPTPTTSHTPTAAATTTAPAAPHTSSSVPGSPPAAKSTTTAGTGSTPPAQVLGGVVSNAVGCVSSPSSCGYPDATNTGITPGTTLAASGGITEHTNGAVIQNLTITNGSINIYAQNVTVRNVKIIIDAPTTWAIFVAAGGSATIDHVDVSGYDQSTRSVENGVLSESHSPVIVEHSNLHECADCIQGENVTATGNFIHDMANPPGAHVDGIQCNSSCGITVTGNTIFNQWGQTSDVALFGDFGTPTNSVVEGNLFAGGGYSVYGGTTASTGIRILDNRFATLYYPNGGAYGPGAHFSQGNSGNIWSGNVWDATKAAVNY